VEIFHIISVIVPVVIALVLPKLVEGREHRNRTALYIACALFFVSWYLPSPLIDGQDTSFVTHVVGGGMFTGLLWVYLRYVLRWSVPWYLEVFSLFALVSALGAINELFELALVEANIATILLADTSWDILANTAGALGVYIGYKIYDSWNR
jgi:hypothetical protein